MLEMRTVSRPALRGSHDVWIQAPATQARCILVFLDGELYIERVRAPELIPEGVACVYLSFGATADRHRDFTCNPQFAAFLVGELLPWIEREVGPHEEVFLCGLSLSGLAAIFIAHQHPETFAGVLAQSPSAWWHDEWLTGAVSASEASGNRFWISVGTDETESNATHAPTGLVQRSSQLDSCRRLREALRAAGHEVSGAEFARGHAPAAWAADLPTGLRWLLSPTR